MGDVTDIAKVKMTPRERAEAELKAERESKATEQLKVKLRELHVAERVVENLKEEIAVLERDLL